MMNYKVINKALDEMILEKQEHLPPRPGLIWDSNKHRWIRPEKEHKLPYAGWDRAESPKEGRSWRVVRREAEGKEVWDVIDPQSKKYWVTAVNQERAQSTADKINRHLQEGK